MGCGIEWESVFIAPNHVTTLLFTLLCRVVMLLAKGLPVGIVPEELLSLCYLFLFASVNRFLQPMRLDVVNNSSRHCSALPVAHRAERVRLQK
jgi:hypothetical protein